MAHGAPLFSITIAKQSQADDIPVLDKITYLLNVHVNPTTHFFFFFFRGGGG